MGEGGDGLAPVGSWEFYLNSGLAFGCVCLAALAAGLTMGLVAIEPFRLQILLETKEADCTSAKQVRELRREKACAVKILPVVTQHHLLLVTLLLLNSLANECLPLFLDEVVPTGVAIILSVTFVLLFGEIIPSAIFTGPKQLFIAAAFVPMVRVAMFLLWPIAYPVSRVLDCVLGEEHPDKFNKAELRALVKLHAHTPRPRRRRRPSELGDGGADIQGSPASSRAESDLIRSKLEEIGVDERTAAMAALATTAAREAIDEEAEDYCLAVADGDIESGAGHAISVAGAGVLGSSPTGASVSQLGRFNSTVTHGTTMTEGGLEVDEVLIMHGALDLKETTAEEKMIPLMHVYMISTETVLTESMLADMLATGHSRVPVFSKDRTNIRGLLLVKKLIVINPQDNRRVSTLYLRMPVFVHPRTSLLELLNIFQRGGSHMAVVTDGPQRMADALKRNEAVPEDVNVLGICTLEDIIEALIKEDISDETDFHQSVKHSLFTQQRKKRLMELALKQKQKRKLKLSGVAALVNAQTRSSTRPVSSRSAVSGADYGSMQPGQAPNGQQGTASSAEAVSARGSQTAEKSVKGEETLLDSSAKTPLLQSEARNASDS